MFKALLLATWYDLSDVTLAESLSDRASFRRFCGFSRDEETPERTAFVRFRRALSLGINRHDINQCIFFGLADSAGSRLRSGLHA